MTNEIFINYFVYEAMYISTESIPLRMKISWADKIPLIIDECQLRCLQLNWKYDPFAIGFPFVILSSIFHRNKK